MLTECAARQSSPPNTQQNKTNKQQNKTYKDNFPEHLGCMFLINCPMIVRSIWAVIKPFLDERTLLKIKVSLLLVLLLFLVADGRSS